MRPMIGEDLTWCCFDLGVRSCEPNPLAIAWGTRQGYFEFYFLVSPLLHVNFVPGFR